MSAAIDLATLTDAAAMRGLLQQQLPGFADGRLRIETLDVGDVRRNTSHRRNPCPLTLCYELQVSDTAQRRTGSQRLYAQVFRAGGAAAVFARHDPRRLVTPAFGEPLVHLPALDLLLWALPNDPGLPQLAALLDPVRAVQHLPRSERRGAAAGLRIELLRHTPQCRATLRYTFSGAADEGARTLYAKTFFDDRWRAIDTRFRYFRRLSERDRDAPIVARPLGHDALTRTIWQAPAPGAPLRESLAGPGGAALMGRVARALARLHAARLSPGADAAPRSVDHWCGEVWRRRNKIARIDAPSGDRASRIVDAIESAAGPLAMRPLGLIHGDFHPDQVWVAEGRIVLFDFDEFSLGDPMEDLAEFIVKLEQGGAAPALAEALIRHYADAAPDRFDRRSLAWHLAVQSLLQATRAFVYQQPGWADVLDRRLAASEVRAAALPRTGAMP